MILKNIVEAVLIETSNSYMRSKGYFFGSKIILFLKSENNMIETNI
jgi:hypothetical protein